MGELEFRDPFVGRIIGEKYEVLRRLGTGGMGAVYHARHLQTGGDIAIKFLHGTAAADESSVRRFQVEAQNAAALRHANTIRVMDFGVDAGTFYLVMEYLEGRSLAEILAEDGPIPWPRVIAMTRQILKALWEAHEHPRRIIHRDIKPANLFVVDLPGDDDHVRVLDFGVSRALAASGAGTQGLIGTPLYMAPEMWRGGTIDGRTDLYALGCVVYQMLAGTPPFMPPPSAPDILFPLLNLHLHEDAPPIEAACPDVPASLAAWVRRLLAKDPAARPPSARVALEELDVLAAGLSDGGRSAAVLARAAVTPRPATPVPGPLRAAAVALEETVDAHRDRSQPVRSNAVQTASSRAYPARAMPVWLVAVLVIVAVGGTVAAIVLAAGGPAKTAGSSGMAAVALRAAPTDEPTNEPTVEPKIIRNDGPSDGPTDDPGTPALGPVPMTHPVFGTHAFTFTTRLSEGDHLDAYGQRIVTAGGILARDRERLYVAMGMGAPGPDSEDETDPALANPAARVTLEQAITQTIEPTVAHVILTHTPLVRVAVFERGLVVEVEPETD